MLLERKPAIQIADEQGCTENNILYFLHKNEIPRRNMLETRKIKYWGSSGDDNPMYNRKGELNPNWKGGIVLDPFCGRGTTGKVAKELGLHYILFDIKPKYCDLARLYIGGQKRKLFKDQSNLDGF